ncbi:oligosaccharide flippase family protein [bacterium]|nr:oligosaccharide flippase family protein [bacterium]
MFQELKSLSKESMVYGTGHILTRFVTFLLLPYYSYQLTPAEYGEVTLYYLFLAVMQTFFFYGMDIAFLRYYTLQKDEQLRKKIFGTALVASFLTSVMLLLVLSYKAPQISLWLILKPIHPEIAASMIRVCAVILLFDTLSTFPFIMLRGTHRPYHFVSIKLLNVAVNICLNILFVGVWKWSVAGVLWANFWAAAITLAIQIPSIISKARLSFDRGLLKQMLVFGLPNIPTYLFVMAIELADRKILESLRGLEEAGLYSAGYKLGMFMAVVTGAFRFAWQPFFLSHADQEDAPRLFARVLTYFVLICGFLFLSLSLLVPDLVKLSIPGAGGTIIEQRYWAGLAVFPIILLAHIFDGIYANLMVGVYLKKKTLLLPWVTGTAALVNVGGNILLVPVYGMWAAAWLTLAAFIIEAFLLWVLIRRSYPVPYEWGRLLHIALTVGVLFFLGSLEFAHGWIASVILIIALPIVLFGTGFFRPEEKRRLLEMLHRS